MTTFEFWPDLFQAWQATRGQGPDAEHAAGETADGGKWKVLKNESRARVLLLDKERFAPIVLKIYRTPSRLAWRTIGCASRANREFTVMMKAHRLGLSIARPWYWLERRSAGRVEFSALALEAVDGSDLESWLIREQGSPEQRRCAAEATGRLLGEFHRAGLLWGTASSRNLLMPGGSVNELLAIDMPYARLHGRDIRDSTHALMDLGLALLLSDGQNAFDDREREALMRAYCMGNKGEAHALNEQLHLPSHREWKRSRIMQRLGNLFSRTASSEGKGGVYNESGTYQVLDDEGIFSLERQPGRSRRATP